MKYTLEVKEQPPLEKGSVFTEVKLVKRNEDGKIWSEMIISNPYFVHVNKKITQISPWLLQEYREELIKLGYKI